MWIIIADSRTYAVGPFPWVFDAEQYAKNSLKLKPEQYVIKELIAPIKE